MDVLPIRPPDHNDSYFKISPGLFTPERLDSFESIDLYTSLISHSNRLENGRRLNNISWRIVNKALLKDHSINKSKKRDGVKNIYFILNPSVPSGLSRPTRQQTPQPPQQQPPAVKTPTPYKSNTTAALFQKYQPVSQKKDDDPQNIIKGFDTSTTITKKPIQQTPITRQESLFNTNANINESNSFFNQNKADNKIFFSSEDEYSDWNSISDENNDEDNDDYDDDDFYNDDEDDNANRFSVAGDDDDDDDQYYKNQWDKLMFTKNHTSDINISLQSQGISVSAEHTKKSLLSGLFSNEKTSAPTASNSLSSSSSSIAKGQYYYPLSNHNIPTTISHPKATTSTTELNKLTLETSNITALGSVTPPPPHLNSAVPLESIIRKSKPINTHNRTNDSNNAAKDIYLHESNAPLTAQTLLPTALSTHMFLPNNIHQQRMAAAAASNTGVISRSDASSLSTSGSRHNGSRPRTSARRESMDIPSKNRNSGLLKTRMEISEEEKNLVRTLSRHNNNKK